MPSLEEKKKALNRYESLFVSGDDEAFRIVLDALRREIEAEEARLPKEVTLEEVHRDLNLLFFGSRDTIRIVWKDVDQLLVRARVLRDEIVPGLRDATRIGGPNIMYRGAAMNLIRKLGETP